MAFSGFTPADFKVFDIDGFAPRMQAIRTRIRPKLEAIGRDLLPDVGRIAGDQAFAHVAKHARRTVNPPDDTWIAFALDKRGYKKRCHSSWKRQGPKLAPVLRRAKGLAWFKNEHDESPAAVLADLSSDEVTRLGDELVLPPAGQVGLGGAGPAQGGARWKPATTPASPARPSSSSRRSTASR